MKVARYREVARLRERWIELGGLGVGGVSRMRNCCGTCCWRRVDLQHDRRMSDDGRTAYDWWGAGWSTETEGYWHTFSPLAESEELDAFAWPDPQAPQLFDGARQTEAQRGAEYFVAPNLGMCLFERAWSLRGFDRLLLDFADRPEWVEELLERITGIQVALIRRYIEAGVDGGYFGDDYGALSARCCFLRGYGAGCSNRDWRACSSLSARRGGR